MIETEVITPEAASSYDLASLAASVKSHLDTIEAHEEAFMDATLEYRLQIGQTIAQAQAVFGLSRALAGTHGGRPTKTLVRRDPAGEEWNSAGFSNWLKREIPRLNRSTARKYSTAFQGLGVDRDAPPSQIRERIATLRKQAAKSNLPMPTLATLFRAAPKPAKPDAPLALQQPRDTAQLRLEDAREVFHTLYEKFDAAVERGLLDDLDREGLKSLYAFSGTVLEKINKRLKDPSYSTARRRRQAKS